MQVQELVIPGRAAGEKFVRWVPGVLSPAECDEWIRFVETQGFAPASLLASGERNPRRSNDRVLLRDPTRAALLTDRLREALPTVWGSKRALVGCNTQLSCLRYQTDQCYGRHVDVPFETAGASSVITAQLYLNEGFKGGETRFVQEVGFKHVADRLHLDVVPERGAVLLFEHELEHEGRPVHEGTKYTIRVDVMYTEEQ